MSLKLQSQYEKLDDQELLRLAADRTSLTDEAALALDAEMRVRGLTAEDAEDYQHLLKREKQRRAKKRSLASKRDWNSRLETAVAVFWTAVAFALIWTAYFALPSQYRLPPIWHEAAGNVMWGAACVVAASKEWWKRPGFWAALS